MVMYHVAIIVGLSGIQEIPAEVSQHHYYMLNQGWGIPAHHLLQETLWLSFCGPSSCCCLIWAASLPINFLPSLTQSKTLRKQIIQLYRWQKMSQSRVYSVFCSSTLPSVTAHTSDCQGNKIWRSLGLLMTYKNCLLIAPAEKLVAKSRTIFSVSSLQI